MHRAEWRPDAGMDEEEAERPQRDEELVEAARAGSREAFGELGAAAPGAGAGMGLLHGPR